jgi:hypothetical protein
MDDVVAQIIQNSSLSLREPAWRWLFAEGASHGVRRRHGIELVARG